MVKLNLPEISIAGEHSYCIVAIIGSLKFMREHDKVVEMFVRQGHVPIPLVLLDTCIGTEEQRKVIADCHIRKVIDISDVVYVLNKDNYVGPSVLSEINYAAEKKKPIVYAKSPLDDDLLYNVEILTDDGYIPQGTTTTDMDIPGYHDILTFTKVDECNPPCSIPEGYECSGCIASPALIKWEVSHGINK